jgi:hypothetical protein
MVHGDETPAAYVVINPPANLDLTKDLAIDEGLARLGVKQDAADLAERYGREVAEEVPQEVISDQSAVSSEDPEDDAEKMVAENELDALRSALSADLQPLGEALAGALQAGDEAAFRSALKKISARMPEFLESAELEALLQSEFVTALTEETES